MNQHTTGLRQPNDVRVSTCRVRGLRGKPPSSPRSRAQSRADRRTVRTLDVHNAVYVGGTINAGVELLVDWWGEDNARWALEALQRLHADLVGRQAYARARCRSRAAARRPTSPRSRRTRVVRAAAKPSSTSDPDGSEPPGDLRAAWRALFRALLEASFTDATRIAGEIREDLDREFPRREVRS